jgi:SAM-dependent methyltransferase
VRLATVASDRQVGPARDWQWSPVSLDDLLAEQIGYYRAVAPESFEHGIDSRGGAELEAALEALRPAGDVLELAPGPGTWTPRLVGHAASLTAVDAAPEVLALAARRVGDDARVRLVQADLFSWRPDRRYDVAFFGFWLSHVPLERFDAFWATVADALAPGGRVLFFDDAYRTAEELIEASASGAGSTTAARTESSRCPTHPSRSGSGYVSSAGRSKCTQRAGRSSGAQGNVCSPP